MGLEIGLILAFAEAMQKISGYSVKDIIEKLGARERRLINAGIVRFLALFDKDSDPVTGVWTVSSWNF